jgi:BrnA antitoxin of type II toxin-antitoxin system
VLARLKSEGKGYQTRINTCLREAMLRPKKKAATAGRPPQEEIRFIKPSAAKAGVPYKPVVPP